MSSAGTHRIRVLVADDETMVLDCYREAFAPAATESFLQELDELESELFGDTPAEPPDCEFDFVGCRQGEEAVDTAARALGQGEPFDVVILDMRMPPGISGLQAGERIRALDPDVPIIFVTGYSDAEASELQKLVPPPHKLRCLAKPIHFAELIRLTAALGGGAGHQP